MGLGMENCDNNVILSYLDYVKSRALNYVGFGVSYDDLVQIGSIALIRAINNYNHKRNFKEYLNIYINSFIQSGLIKNLTYNKNKNFFTLTTNNDEIIKFSNLIDLRLICP